MKRLGGSAGDAADVKSHCFFKGIDWGKVATKEMDPVFVPNVRHSQDLSNIDDVFLREQPIDSPCLNKITRKEMKKYNFESFSYTKDNDDSFLYTHSNSTLS